MIRQFLPHDKKITSDYHYTNFIYSTAGGYLADFYDDNDKRCVYFLFGQDFWPLSVLDTWRISYTGRDTRTGIFYIGVTPLPTGRPIVGYRVEPAERRFVHCGWPFEEEPNGPGRYYEDREPFRRGEFLVLPKGKGNSIVHEIFPGLRTMAAGQLAIFRGTTNVTLTLFDLRVQRVVAATVAEDGLTIGALCINNDKIEVVVFDVDS